MLRLLAPVLLAPALLSAGCATTPAVRLHADPAGLARLAPAVVQPLTDKEKAARDEAERDTGRANERVTKAELALKAAREEPRAAGTDQVREAKIDRAEADARWQRSLLEVARWRGVVAQADVERSKAEVMQRAGQDVDLDAFALQQQRCHAAMNDAAKRAAADRTRLDEAETRLMQAKESYAKSHAATQASAGR